MNKGKRILVVVDMQEDFTIGVLGNDMTKAVVANVVSKMKDSDKYDYIILTRDIHFENYLDTLEGTKLPIVHCQKGEKGAMIVKDIWDVVKELRKQNKRVKTVDKHTFASKELVDYLATICNKHDVIEFCGVCTDICVVSNAICLRAALPNNVIIVDSSCCAGTTVDNHNAALTTMASCQIDVV